MVPLVVGFEEGEFAADRVVGFCGNCSFLAQSYLEVRERERWDTSSMSQICKSCVVCDDEEEEEGLIGWV
jgi:hypothetical protein